MTLPRVQILGVRKHFAANVSTKLSERDHVAVDNVSIDIAAGEFFSLLGPSGCGKTTLLRMLAGFETPDAGRVLIDGDDMTAVPPNHRPTNLVFQHYALFPHLTVEQNVAFGLGYQKIRGAEAKARVADALKQVQLVGFENRKPHQLSGGQKQRVALARALVLRPKVLLLDEPLSALDQKLRREMQIELKHLQRSLGITFVFVTHDQEEALVMSDRIAVMNAGKLEQVGTAATVFERPATEFVARFMGAANFLTDAGRRFVVRPEKLWLCTGGTPPSDAANRRVTIVERLYQGQSMTYTVRDSAGTTISVYQQNGSDIAVMAEGAAAILCWDREDEVPLVPSSGTPGEG